MQAKFTLTKELRLACLACLARWPTLDVAGSVLDAMHQQQTA
jgi:hypothetical protein